MNKSDLRSGMLVTLRNNESYYVMLNTGLLGRQADVLIHRIGDDTGWMPLRNYDNDLNYHDDDDGVFPPNTPEEDREWDIIRVMVTRSAAGLCVRKNYRTVWERM